MSRAQILMLAAALAAAGCHPEPTRPGAPAARPASAGNTPGVVAHEIFLRPGTEPPRLRAVAPAGPGVVAPSAALSGSRAGRSWLPPDLSSR